MSESIYLHEEVLLLALNDGEGLISKHASFYQQAMIGALISELLLREYIGLSKSGSKIIDLKKKDKLEDPLLKEAYSIIKKSAKKQEIKYWFNRFCRFDNLMKRTAYELCKKGVLEQVDISVFWVFTKTHFPEKNPEIENELVNRLEKAIFGKEDTVDLRTATLIALIKDTQILTIPFEADSIKRQKNRIEQITNGDLVADATKEMIEQVKTALFVTTIMPAIMTPIIISN